MQENNSYPTCLPQIQATLRAGGEANLPTNANDIVVQLTEKLRNYSQGISVPPCYVEIYLPVLKQKGATSAVIRAMLGVPTAAPSTAVATPTLNVDAADAWEPNDVYTIVEGKTEQLGFAPAEIRTNNRAMGLGGVGMYAVLHGSNAERSVANKPTFLAAMPKNVQAASYFTLANFAVRKNGDREVMIANGHMMGMRIGVTKDRVIALTANKAADQSKAAKNTMIYEITPTMPLSPGQYALISNLAQTGLGQMSGNYYDFQVQ